MFSDPSRLVPWLASKISKAGSHTGIMWPNSTTVAKETEAHGTSVARNTAQPLGHLMSPLSLKSSPGLPMDTQLFCGFQCPLDTATISHPFLLFLLLFSGFWLVAPMFSDNLTLHKEDQCWLYSAWSQSQSRDDPAASHSLLGVLHRTRLLHGQKLVFRILWGSVF